MFRSFHSHAIIATDCLSLVQKLRSEAMDHLHTGIIIQDIKTAVQASTVVYSFAHVTRCCNKVAHVLARSADQLSVSVWFHGVPEFLWPSVCNDRLHQ